MSARALSHANSRSSRPQGEGIAIHREIHVFWYATRVALWMLCFVALGCSNGGGAHEGPQGGPPSVSVEVVSVGVGSIQDVIDLVGQLESEESVLVKSEIPGVIEAAEFDEGEELRKGAVLFRLRDDEQRARLQEAQAGLDLQEDVHRRTRQLAVQHVAAAAQLERAAAELAAARARVDLARVELERTQIRAPFDGVVGARLVSPGDRITASTGLVQIDAIARLQLVFTVPEIGLPLARAGATVSASVAPYPGESFPGEVFFVAPTLDPTTRRLVLKAWVPNLDRRLRPGLFANVRVELGRREDALLVPEEAVVYDRDTTIVWRVDEGDLAERVPVVLGQRRDGWVEVIRGLKRGDRIVSAGTHKVAAGTKVAPKPPASAERESRSGTSERNLGAGG